MNSKEIMVNLMVDKICEYIDAGDINKIVVHGKEFAKVKKGNWIADRTWNEIKKGDVLKVDEYGVVRFDVSCSVCDKWLVASDEYACYANFCPYCGADMRGNEE